MADDKAVEELEQKFKSIVNEINTHNHFWWGNKILYDMCNACDDLGDSERLAASIWLIGRAYAASPERRSYGKSKGEDGKPFFKEKINGKEAPNWIIRTANDGNGDFFTEISKELVKNEEYQILCDELKKNHKDGYTFGADILTEDITKLANTIFWVYQCNELIKQVTETFDQVPSSRSYTVPGKFTTSEEEETCTVRCKNQISFCSKFLHFHCPNLVFIIDQFSEIGGVQLFTGKKQNLWLELGGDFPKSVRIDSNRTSFKALVDYDDEKAGFNTIYDKVTRKLTEQLEARRITLPKQRSTEAPKAEDGEDPTTVEGYAKHCVRAYLIARYFSAKQITPMNVYGKTDDANKHDYGQSYPRLVDSVLMHIKQKKDAPDYLKWYLTGVDEETGKAMSLYEVRNEQCGT